MSDLFPNSAYTERDFKIFKKGVELVLKDIKKAARLERENCGAGNLSELEEYAEHLLRKVDATLNHMLIGPGDE